VPCVSRRRLPFVCLCLTSACATEPSAPKSASAPKYATHSVPLSFDFGYFRRAAAPDYWALSPYYVGQRDDVSCSLATTTMIVNSARRGLRLGSQETLVTQASLFDRVDSPVWRRGLAESGEGVTLDELARLTTRGLQAFGVVPRAVKISHVAAPTESALRELRATLLENEASPDDWVILNFLAEAYVGTGDYGHFAPVGAYDAELQRVLVLDPDREYYEPYWVPDTVALAGMATSDSVTGTPRGYLYVDVRR
jgi:hypothetical protein